MLTATVTTYLIYVTLSVAVAIWVGRNLRRHGSVFLTEGHETNRNLHEALSHLLVVGFYLVSFGAICFILKIDRPVTDTQNSIEMLSTKLGTVLVVLGAMHFLVLIALSAARKQAAFEHRPYPRMNISRDLARTDETPIVPNAFE